MNPLLFWHRRRNLFGVFRILVNISHDLLYCIGELMILIQDDLTVSVFQFLVRKGEILSVCRLDVFGSGRSGLVIGERLGVLLPVVTSGPGAPLLRGLLLPIYGRRMGLGGGGRRGERIEPIPSWTSPEPHFRLLVDLLVIVDLLSELGEDVIYLIIDGQMTAPQLWPHPVLHLTPGPGSVPLMADLSLVIGLRLSTGGQAVIKLSNDSIEEIQTAPYVITGMKERSV